jgi:hypothetical protein
MSWSVAKVALADLIGRFRHDTSAAEVGAARVFTGLVADHVWVLDTDVPAQGARPRALNEWRVADRLVPDLGRVLHSRPELIGEMARGARRTQLCARAGRGRPRGGWPAGGSNCQPVRFARTGHSRSRYGLGRRGRSR